jgi:hypothetical protein
MSAVEIYRDELCVVYDQNVRSEGTVRHWCRMFKDGWTNVHDKEWSGWLSVVSDNLVQSVDQKYVKDVASQFQNFHVNFYKFYACSLQDYHIYARLSQVLRKMVSRIVHGCAQNAKNGFGFDFLEWYHKDGDAFLSHIIWVTGDEAWIKAMDTHTFTKWAEKV